MAQTAAADPEQHSVAKSIVLHLFPGLALATFVVLTAPTFAAWGMEPFFVVFIGVGLLMAPLELGYLSLRARRSRRVLALQEATLVFATRSRR